VEAEPLLVGGYEGMKQNAAAVSELNRQKMKKVGERAFFRARRFSKNAFAWDRNRMQTVRACKALFSADDFPRG
jgi:hypothetical protein